MHLFAGTGDVRKRECVIWLPQLYQDEYVNVHICLYTVPKETITSLHLNLHLHLAAFVCLLYLQGHLQWSVISNLMENKFWNLWSSPFIIYLLIRHKINWQTVIKKGRSFYNYSASVSEISIPKVDCCFLMPLIAVVHKISKHIHMHTEESFTRKLFIKMLPL